MGPGRPRPEPFEAFGAPARSGGAEGFETSSCGPAAGAGGPKVRRVAKAPPGLGSERIAEPERIRTGVRGPRVIEEGHHVRQRSFVAWKDRSTRPGLG